MLAIGVCASALAGAGGEAAFTASLPHAAIRPPAAAPTRPAPSWMNSRRLRYKPSSVISDEAMSAGFLMSMRLPVAYDYGTLRPVPVFQPRDEPVVAA